MVGEDIEIKVLSVEGDQVKLGVEAPKSVDIYRKEIYIAIKDENSEAAEAPQDVLEMLKNQE